MFKSLQYYWLAGRGYRLKPWKSPCLRWRFETFLGPEAAQLDAGKFFHLAWKYRAQMERFVNWATERRRIQRRRTYRFLSNNPAWLWKSLDDRHLADNTLCGPSLVRY